jgi:glycosyltransferase involved in cell wall biosynthesis
VFVLPSESELFGISVLEAMASGCAAITADSNGSAHHITHEVDGMVFKEQDFEDFKNCVHRILKNTGLRKSIQRSAPLTIQKNHNYEQFARFIESLV